ncbi:MAG TPA: hypothetical protein VGB85_11540 [Nannocystis sp.]|jgi:hypothetical protein
MREHAGVHADDAVQGAEIGAPVDVPQRDASRLQAQRQDLAGGVVGGRAGRFDVPARRDVADLHVGAVGPLVDRIEPNDLEVLGAATGRVVLRGDGDLGRHRRERDRGHLLGQRRRLRRVPPRLPLRARAQREATVPAGDHEVAGGAPRGRRHHRLAGRLELLVRLTPQVEHPARPVGVAGEHPPAVGRDRDTGDHARLVEVPVVAVVVVARGHEVRTMHSPLPTVPIELADDQRAVELPDPQASRQRHAGANVGHHDALDRLTGGEGKAAQLRRPGRP